MDKTATAYYKSPIGLLCINATDENIGAVLFVGDNKTADKSMDNAVSENLLIQDCIKQLHEYFDGKRKAFDLPIKQSGTVFQHKVWNALLKIEYSKTTSYRELSRAIGDVKATRAVGTSNGKNNISIIVPCHRVIGSNGSLTGYAGGLWRKQWLLEHEAKNKNGVQLLF